MVLTDDLKEGLRNVVEFTLLTVCACVGCVLVLVFG